MLDTLHIEDNGVPIYVQFATRYWPRSGQGG